MLIEIVLCFILIFLIIWKYIQKSRDAPPGPIAFPFIGNLFQIFMINSKNSYIALNELSKKYGDVMTVRFGSEDIVILSSLEVLQETLHKDEWSGRIWNKQLEVRSFNKRLGLIFSDGELWKNQRQFTIRHLWDVGFGKQDSMELIIQDELVELMNRIKQNMGDGHQTVLPMHDFFNLSFLNLIWTLIGGVRHDYDDEKINHILKSLHGVFKSESIGGSVADIFPILYKIAPNIFGKTELIKFTTTVQDFIRDSIHEHKKSKSYGTNHDFLDIYLKEMEQNTGNEDTYFTEEQLITLCLDLFVAGSETTSNTLTYAVLHMILNPKTQNKVYEEIKNVLGKKIPKLEDRAKLPYTEAVLMEVQRISNINPFTPSHQVVENVSLRGYNIKKDTIIFVNLYSVHMNKHHWGDPEIFRPERFLDTDGQLIRDEHLVPFGIGKRICLGESLARMSLFIYFTKLMQNFLFETVPGHLSPSIEPVPGFTLSPQQFHTVVTCRDVA